MTLIRIRPRPSTSYISRGRCVMATSLRGTIEGEPDQGFFIHETRLLSRWRYTIDGEEPLLNTMSAVTHDRSLVYAVIAAPGVTRPDPDHGSGQVPVESQVTLEVRVDRTVDDGLRETIELTNYTMEPTSFVFAIELAADFADAAETGRRTQHGSIDTRWEEKRQRLRMTYRSSELQRSMSLSIDRSSTPARFEDDTLRFDVALPPRGTWRVRLAVTDGEAKRPAGSSPEIPPTSFEAPGSATLTTSVLATLEQARGDLGALRLPDLDHADGSWTVAAGLPLYIALFGRDTLTAGWQAGMIGPEIMTGTLHALAALQGERNDDWRDEQPGKMLHEAHTGPLSMTSLNPRRRSYGSVTTSGLYAFIVAELWHWTGDKALVRPFIEPALRALRWLDESGDLDGDGFYEYRTRSPFGPRNQAWKDSDDAIVYDDGRLVEPPIATSEEQGFVYVAKLHLAETLWWLGERALSRELYRQASELKRRFNEAFWMEDEGFFALALDAEKRPVRSMASNAGHCIAAAIVDASLVERATDRLFAPDLFSGWGIRTLSSDHPRYNPYSYHLGSIWPVEQGTFAIGFMRYGLHDRVEQIARALFEAASLFEFHRLPELFGGHARDAEHPFPGIYPNANSPQAWSASAVFSLLQALLGIYPYAPLKLLVVDPHLPEWLPEITLRDLRVGKARVTIRFRRRRDGRTTYRVLDQRGKLHVVRQATPWSLTTSPAERLRDMLSSLLP